MVSVYVIPIMIINSLHVLRFNQRKQGAAIAATGLAIQALSLIACTGLHFWFTLSLSTRRGTLDARHSQVYSSSQFKKFLMGKET